MKRVVRQGGNSHHHKNHFEGVKSMQFSIEEGIPLPKQSWIQGCGAGAEIF